MTSTEWYALSTDSTRDSRRWDWYWEMSSEWLTGITKNDFRKLDQVLADDLMYLHSTGVMDSKASYVKSLQSGKQKYVAGKINDLKIRVYGQTAVINGDANFDFVTDGKPGKAHLKYTHVFVKGGKGWQLVSHQSLKVAD